MSGQLPVIPAKAGIQTSRKEFSGSRIQVRDGREARLVAAREKHGKELPVYQSCYYDIFGHMNILRRFHPSNATGNKGENLAVDFLKDAGFRILERNYKNRLGRALGEIDIVAEEKGELVFVEVKAREAKPGKLAFPEENITASKLRKLARIAEGYLREKRRETAPYRFDAILIVFREGAEPEIRHFRSIFL